MREGENNAFGREPKQKTNVAIVSTMWSGEATNSALSRNRPEDGISKASVGIVLVFDEFSQASWFSIFRDPERVSSGVGETDVNPANEFPVVCDCGLRVNRRRDLIASP